ncbi:MAG: sodium/proline symporter PutP [Acidobacteria bacterium]|nr:sodium/proline symporter PutP [Acidobacteriota bacterium]
MPWPTLITFIVYFMVLMAIGLFFYRKSRNLEDYLLGGRGMGAWVTALSAQASDMSGWLLMGLPGAIYVSGLSDSWIAIGLFIGTVLNWWFVSGRLRIYTANIKAITLPSFFEARFADPTGLLRIVSAFIILVFFTIYASSGLVAAGRLFESTFNVSFSTAVLTGGIIIVLYTFLGGFLAVCWTDLFQGLLMILAIVIVPIVAFHHIGGTEAIIGSLDARNIARGIIPEGTDTPLLAVFSAMAWGLGYFGQPHILARFMGVKSLAKLRRSRVIAVVWVAISLTGAVVIGMIGIGMYEALDIAQKEHEKVFIYMIREMMGPWLGGVMLAAILSAIMSTIDSQLLVSSSALTEDFYRKVVRRKAGEREVMFIGRACVIVISVIALIMAMDPRDSILRIVAYAWGGFGAAFGPLVLFALFSRRTTWRSALLGMIVGTVVLVLWKHSPWGGMLYEIVPGFLANTVTILIADFFFPQSDPNILAQYRKSTRL